MMRTIYNLILTGTLALTLAACSRSDGENDSQDSTTRAGHVTPPDTSMLNRDSVNAGADTATKSRDSARIQMGVQKP